MTDETTEAARLIAAKRKTAPGICARCSAPFTGLARRRYCSKLCGILAWQAANPERMKAARAKTYRARRRATPAEEIRP